jgi:putative DNA primase/helicase
MIELAQSESGIPVVISDFDSDPWLLNVLNGTLELKTSKLRTHRREDLITRIVPVGFDSEARCPRWDSFLDEIMAGDRDMIKYLQKVIGYSLTGSNQEQVIFILYGSGANGKSTFVATIHRLLESYAKKTPTETLLVKNTSGISNDIARLNGARFVSADEAEHGRHLAESLVKQLTGGDKISARYLYSEFFDFDPTFKLFLDVNHKPIIRGSEHAIWRRIHLIPFNVFTADKRDKDLLAKLQSELPGILRWAVEGCSRWQTDGLEPPQAVKSASTDYRSEMDVVGDFLREHCEVDANAKTPFKDLFDAYAKWTQRNEDGYPDSQEFARALSDRGFPPKRNNTLGRYRTGLRLKPNDG